MFDLLLEWLYKPLEIFGLPTTNLELVAFVSGLAAVWLCVRNKVMQWPIGVFNSVVFLWVFLDAGLYADAGLMVFFTISCFYGWYWWLHGGRDKEELPTRKANWYPLQTPPPEERKGDSWRNSILLTVILMVVAWAIMGTSVDRFTDSNVAFWDAGTTAISLAAQYLLMRRLVENWHFWITVDVMYIGLYWYKDLHFSSILYFIFLLMCLRGVVAWRQDAKRDANRSAVNPNIEAAAEAMA